MKPGILVAALSVMAAAVPLAGQDARSSVPDAADQKRAEKVIRDFFRNDYQSRDAAARSALAEKLLKEAGATQGDAVTVYVLLREARDVAAEAGNAALAFEAISRMAERFDVKVAELKAAALAAARKKASTPEDLGRVAEALLGLAEEQIRKDELDDALRGARDAESAARSAKDSALASRAAALVRDIPEMKRLHEPYAKAEMTLSSNPADPDACLTCGRYLCMVRGDWDAGLPLLAKGNNAALADLAMKELAKPEEAAAQLEIADLWYELAEKEKNALLKRRGQSRARTWYEKAVPGATGLVQLKASKRLADLEAALGPPAGGGSGAPVDLLRLIDPAKDTVSGTWSFSGNVLVTPPGGMLQIPYSPPAEYDLMVVAEKKDVALFCIGLVASGNPFSVLLDHQGSTASCIGLFGAGVAGEPSTFFKGEAFSRTTASTVVCSVRKASVTVLVDKKKIVEYKGDCSKLPLDPGYRIPDPKALGVGSNSPYNILKIVLTPVSGQGRRLR